MSDIFGCKKLNITKTAQKNDRHFFSNCYSLTSQIISLCWNIALEIKWKQKLLCWVLKLKQDFSFYWQCVDNHNQLSISIFIVLRKVFQKNSTIWTTTLTCTDLDSECRFDFPIRVLVLDMAFLVLAERLMLVELLVHDLCSNRLLWLT